ncbi:YceI family protein [Algoriphagus sp. CAU 1675]|uniref:YceI family protein n=1 Tax=Algoriphagus sp. CAU 1675 TaxID=3032597 RepID=UPI0023D9EF90|nr:YceI family protein [Algoriphagus sp. CAU 1675]MDF2156708.1 YceI family protein [Algoriphagus sp. CAU 1675]
MKRSNLIGNLILMGLLLFLGLQVQAQQTFKLSGVPEIKVSGTSTIHDWHMVAKDGIKGQASVSLENNKISGIQSLVLEVPVKSLKSGKSSMDKNAYEALVMEKFPVIRFQLLEVNQITGDLIKAKGKLTISGTSRDITMDVRYKLTGNTVQFTGTHPIKFTQFSLDPPTAVFNTIKTGDELNISFNTTFSQEINP